MSDDSNNDLVGQDPSQVIDLVEYKIMRQLREFPVGSIDWEVTLGILEAYLSDQVSVHWTGDDMFVQMKSGSNVDPEDLIPVFIDDTSGENE